MFIIRTEEEGVVREELGYHSGKVYWNGEPRRGRGYQGLLTIVFQLIAKVYALLMRSVVVDVGAYCHAHIITAGDECKARKSLQLHISVHRFKIGLAFNWNKSLVHRIP